jgi:pyrophosphatase PpaX
VDSLDAWCSTFNDTLGHFGLKTIPRKKFIKDFGAPIEQDVRKYFKGKTIKEVEHAYNLKFKRSMKHLKLFPESVAVLKKLKKHKAKVGLITNSTRFIVSAILHHFKLKNYFQAIVTMDDVKKRKPAPDMILKACKILKVKPKNTILVGDTKNDIIAGKRAGCITVGYKINGDYRTDRLSSIARFLK